jgi:probable rRNA maturation factor
MCPDSKKNGTFRITTNVFNHLKGIAFYKRGVSHVASAICRDELASDRYYLSVIFVGDEEMRELNHAYRSIDEPTDVLSFSCEDVQRNEESVTVEHRQAGVELGDIFISIDTAERQALEDGKPLREEIITLLVHGILHLCGYDHETEVDATLMFPEQDMYVQRFLYEDTLFIRTGKRTDKSRTVKNKALDGSNEKGKE